MIKQGRLVIVTGIDGCGKSSLLDELEKIGHHVSHWRRLAKKDLEQSLNFTSPASYVQTLDGRKRLDFIRRYIETEWKYLIKPALLAGGDIIADSFFIKFYGKEQIYGRLLVHELLGISPLTGKELIVFIDTPPEMAFQRKQNQKISKYECYKSRDDFIEFQTILRGNILSFTDTFERVVIDGTKSSESVLLNFVEVLEKYGIRP